MTFAELVAALSKDVGEEIEIENDTCAVRTGEVARDAVTILLQGFDERRALLMTANLGQPPPERLERLYRTILEANDLFRDTCGATLSVNPAAGNVRLQRFDPYEVLSEVGLSRALRLFADVATAWARIVRDYREEPPQKEADPSPDGNLLGVRV